MTENGKINIEDTSGADKNADNESTSIKSAESEVGNGDTKDKKNRNGIVYWIRDIAIAVVLALILLQFINPTMVRQQSMMDTLNDGDYILINKQAYRFGEVKHGDIIVFRTDELDTDGKEKKLIKRAIALPGDTLQITEGRVYLNDKELTEPYLREQYTGGEIEKMVIPDNNLFAMGDNRAYSRDSREISIGLIDMDNLEGEAIFRVFPLGDMGTLR